MEINESAYIERMALHVVGNKAANEGVVLSSKPVCPEGEISVLLSRYFLGHFKPDEFFNFYHDTDLEMNEVYTYVSRIFEDPASLQEHSVNLAKFLYENSVHPKIKGGEFYVVYFQACGIGGGTHDAVGLFKSENKDTFLKVYPSGEGFEIESQQGININKLDKGCLVFNTGKEEGYTVAVVDNTNKGAEALYWIDDFLHVRQRKDEYYKTHNLLSMCRNFITKELPGQFEVSRAEQAGLLNRSVQFFQEKEAFRMDEFTHEVIAQPDVIESFNAYKETYARERDVEFPDTFDISPPAVKKQSRVFKSVIKLDKNFHIYVHGDNRLIQKGFDEDTGMHYYQLFFKEEQ